MRSILEELYGGEICPAEQIVPKDPEYRKTNRKLSDAMDAWEKKLSKDDFEQLKTLLDLCFSVGSMEAASSFVYGFRLGAGIAAEALGQGELARETGD